MKRFVNLVAMVGAFVAGIIFVYSCGNGSGGGGGSNVLAEITDVTGIESGLTMIGNTLNSIKTSVDSGLSSIKTSVDSGLNSIKTSINSVDGGLDSIKTSIDSVDSNLAALNTSNEPEREVFSILAHAPTSGLAVEVLTVPSDKKLVITDLRNISPNNEVHLRESSDIWYRYIIDPDEVTHFNTGIVYEPGEVVCVQHSSTTTYASSVWLSGYYL